LGRQRHIEYHCSKRRKAIQMRFEGLVQDRIPGLHSMPTRIPRLLIAASEDKRCIGTFMNVAAAVREEGKPITTMY
jgi:hypothetical protein